MTHCLSSLLLSAGLVLAAGGTAAQAYKWRDADGKLHFSNTPPPSGKAEKLEMKPAVPENPEAAARFRESQSAQYAFPPPQKKAARQPSEQDCLAAQRELDVLNRQRPVYRVGKDGQRHYLEDADRATEVQRAQNRVARNCR